MLSFLINNISYSSSPPLALPRSECQKLKIALKKIMNRNKHEKNRSNHLCYIIKVINNTKITV